jgi:hypothetical protein
VSLTRIVFDGNVGLADFIAVVVRCKLFVRVGAPGRSHRTGLFTTEASGELFEE